MTMSIEKWLRVLTERFKHVAKQKQEQADDLAAQAEDPVDAAIKILQDDSLCVMEKLTKFKELGLNAEQKEKVSPILRKHITIWPEETKE